MNFSSATLFLEGWFHEQWADRTLVSYESQNIPLPEHRPAANESWLRFTLSGVGGGRRSLGRNAPWTIWPFLLSIQVFVPPSSGHNVSDDYVSQIVILSQNLDLMVPAAGARWVSYDPPFPPLARSEREWFMQSVVQPLQLEWRG